MIPSIFTLIVLSAGNVLGGSNLVAEATSTATSTIGVATSTVSTTTPPACVMTYTRERPGGPFLLNFSC